MQKKILITIATVGVIAGTAFMAHNTNAFGLHMNGSTKGIEQKAETLGTTTEQLKTELETKTFETILEERDITQTEFQSKMQEQMTEKLRERGLTEAQIQERMTEHQERMQEKQEALAELMGIDVATLTQELENSSLPELLDKYEVSHVALHDAFKDLGPIMAGRGMGMMH